MSGVTVGEERGQIGPKNRENKVFFAIFGHFWSVNAISRPMLFNDTKYHLSVIFQRKKLCRINQSGGHSRGSKGSNWTKNGVNWLNTRRFNLESTFNYSKDTNNQYRVHLKYLHVVLQLLNPPQSQKTGVKMLKLGQKPEKSLVFLYFEWYIL